MAESPQVILNRMLGSLDKKYDTSSGSVMYDINAPTSIESEKIQKETDDIKRQLYIDNLVDDELTRKCAEMGIDRKKASYSSGTVRIRGLFGATVPKGELVASELLTFEIIENATVPVSGEVEVKVRCRTSGVAGNIVAGAITSFPKTLTGLNEVTNLNGFDNGYDEESDEDLRARYYLKMRTPSTSGNKHHYVEWALETEGTGGAKCIPRWNGRGSVKVVIINSSKVGANEELVQRVADHIEDVRPVLADVTVVSAEELEINIAGTLILSGGSNTGVVINAIESKVKEYLMDIAFKQTYVSIAKIGQIILETTGVEDYRNLTLNGDTSNVAIGNEQVAVCGSVALSV